MVVIHSAKIRSKLYIHKTIGQKMKFSIKEFLSMWPNPQETADLVTFTEEILNEKLHIFVQ